MLPEDVFTVGDLVTGRGELVGTVQGFDAVGDAKVRWEDGEEFTYPKSFLTNYSRPTTHDAICPPPPASQGEVRLTDEVTGAQKGMKPERFELLPWDALAEVARVYAYGATKYSARNWERGYPWTWSFSAACRHLWRWMIGETHDAETGLHHAAHACFHCLALVAYTLRGVGTDDRP